MAGYRISLLDRVAHRHTVRRWARAARNANDARMSELRGLRSAAPGVAHPS